MRPGDPPAPESPGALPAILAGCGAVVVCFNPHPGLIERLAVLATQVQRLVVVDNGPAEQHPALLEFR